MQCPLIPSSCWSPIEWRLLRESLLHARAYNSTTARGVLGETEGTHISERDAPWTLGLARKISLSTRACLRVYILFFFPFLCLSCASVSCVEVREVCSFLDFLLDRIKVLIIGASWIPPLLPVECARVSICVSRKANFQVRFRYSKLNVPLDDHCQ